MGFAKDQEIAGNVVTTSQPRSSDVAQGVGVGVGEIQGKTLPPNGGLSSIPEGQNIWDFGVVVLGGQGSREKATRGLISSWLKDWHEADVEAAIRAAVGTNEPRKYVIGYLKKTLKKGETARQGVAL